MNQRLALVINKIMKLEPSPTRLAASCSLGIFMACSPFFGIQTILAGAASWLLGFNTPVVIAILYIVNNPLTMIPIMIADYLTGYFILKKALGCPPDCAVPAFLQSTDAYIRATFASWIPGMEFSLLYYLVGGIIFATFCALVSYPLLSRWFKQLTRASQAP